MNQCPNCGAGIAPSAVRCVKCGSVLRDADPPAPAPAQSWSAEPPPLPHAAVPAFQEPRNELLAGALSLLVCGLGQLYNGQFVKGAMFFIVAFFAWCVLLGWVVHIVAAVEAYRTASSRNRGVPS